MDKTSNDTVDGIVHEAPSGFCDTVGAYTSSLATTTTITLTYKSQHHSTSTIIIINYNKLSGNNVLGLNEMVNKFIRDIHYYIK